MSRFYNIVVGAETANPPGGTASNNAGAVWTNFVNGRADLGAQTVEFDLYLYQFDAPVSQASVRIWGPTKAQISQARQFNGAPISVYGGMQNGLPLATAAVADKQQGLLLQGQIFQAFGNNQGLVQTLDFIVTSDFGATQASPANISFAWKKGQPLSTVIQSVLTTAFPQAPAPVINISSSLVLGQDEAFVYKTLQQFATYIRGISTTINKDPSYPGVAITVQGQTFQVYDGTVAPKGATKTLKQQDLIGQVTWLDLATIQFSTVMRADLSVGSQVTLPLLAGVQAVTTAQSFSNVRSSNAFTGTWTITNMRHVGNSRAPDAQSWVSTFEAITNTTNQAALSVAASSS